MPWTRRCSTSLRRSTTALAAVGPSGRVQGFPWWLRFVLSSGHIAMVVLGEDRRGQGVGRALVHAAIGERREIN